MKKKKSLPKGGAVKPKTKHKKKNSVKKTPQLKKNLKSFLLSEEGKISKKQIVKVGLGLAAASLILDPKKAMPQTHSNTFFATGEGGHDSHSSHASHGAHGSHGSHGATWR